MADYGTAIIELRSDGKHYVVTADDRIGVSPELLEPGATAPGVWVPDDTGGVLTLDSNGEYRYRMVGRALEFGQHEVYVFERILQDAP